ncbi:MAG: iron-sulfur cluster insertion protein ErpA [Pseudohongiellaceae bacterium]
MSAVQSQEPVIMSLTDNAVEKVRSLTEEQGNPSLKLRVYVTGGGCSGFQYGFSFEDEATEEDTLVEQKGATLLVDPLSYQYLVGSRVDYVENLEGARFVVENPMASTTCGCGSSFSV